MDNTNGETLFTDLTALVDKSLLDGNDPNMWKAIPYETESFAGVMLGSGDGENPVPIALRLNVEGWHRVWVAIYSYGNFRSLRFRLSGDPCFQTVSPPADTQGDGSESTSLYEFLWKKADLTGQELVVAADPTPSEVMGAGLAYVRLERTEKPPPLEKKTVRHPLTITEDGFGIFGARPFSRPEDLLEPFESVPDDSCLRTLIWGTQGGDMANFPTRAGNCVPVHAKVAGHFQSTFLSNLALFQDKGWNSLEIVRDYAKKRGWEFQVYLRMQAFCSPFPMDRVIHSEFFTHHPEYHCLDKEGNRVMRLSYAFPEVQAHLVDVIREISGYDPDGICLAFIRGVPLVLYETPMIEGFTNKHGVDPRQLPETDLRWLEYQAEVVTAFLTKVKESLKPDQRLSVIVPANEFDCKKWALDVETWVRDGIVDDLIPTGQRFDETDVHLDDPGNLDFDYFNNLPGRKKIRLKPMLYPWELFGSDYKAWTQHIYSYLDRGADGYAVWDALATPDFGLSELGYEERSEYVPPKPEHRKTKIKSLSGFRFDRYHYFEVV